MVIDHDEAKCEHMLHNECVYVIAVINNGGPDRRALYKLTAQHSQNNHALLQEGTPHIDSVENKKLKYYKFTLMEDNDKISNVTFEISPLHGDADLYISRNESQKFPTRDSCEQKSQRIGNLVDHLMFTRKPNDTAVILNGTYYIGVYGYSFTTFSLLVTVHRSKATKQEKVQNFASVLYEGFPHTKRLHNELDMFFGYFQVDIAENDD